MAEHGPRVESMSFKPNGRVPNSRYPVLLYGGAVATEGGGDLADAIEYARTATGAAESMIELSVDGVYACSIHQKTGWPQRICAPPRGS